MTKILLTGSTGMLGNALIRAFLPDKRYALTGMGRSRTDLLHRQEQLQVDFSQPASIRAQNIEVDVAIHTAALTDLKLCESQPDLARKVHVDASAEVAGKVKPGGLFIYISTDSVFDGRKGNYAESDVPSPLNVYASTKLKGEEVCTSVFSRTMTLRTNIYGFHNPLRGSLAEWAYVEWRKGNTISGFTDVIFNALYVGQLADIIKTIVDKGLYQPLLNVASQEVMSKYQFLDLFRSKLELPESLVRKASSVDFPSPIQRPPDTSLDITLLKSFYNAPSIGDGLAQWIRDVRQLEKNTIHH
jgi:dTDP-4-dehydrorhamnose reductase